MSNITDSELEKLAEKEYPYWNHVATDRIVDAARRAFVKGYKAALQNKVNNPCLLELVRKVTDILEGMDLKDSNRNEILKIKMGLQAILQENKVSDISAGEILRKHLKPLYNHEGDLNDFIEERGEELIAAMEEYASIVNGRKDIGGSFNYGYNEEMQDELYKENQELKKRLNVRKDNTSINDAIEFAEWIDKNNWERHYPVDNNPSWHCMGYNEKVSPKTSFTTQELYKEFQESQPQQKEVDEERLIF